jgi:hypothetical protein
MMKRPEAADSHGPARRSRMANADRPTAWPISHRGDVKLPGEKERQTTHSAYRSSDGRIAVAGFLKPFCALLGPI